MPVFPLLLNIVLEIRVYTVRPQKEKLKSILINVSGECFIKKKKKVSERRLYSSEMSQKGCGNVLE